MADEHYAVDDTLSTDDVPSISKIAVRSRFGFDDPLSTGAVPSFFAPCLHFQGVDQTETPRSYWMVGKLQSGTWVSWVARGCPDPQGVQYTGTGVLDASTVYVA